MGICTVCNFVIDFRLNSLVASVDMSKFKNGRVHFSISGGQIVKLIFCILLTKYLYFSDEEPKKVSHYFITIFIINIETP